VVRPRPRWGSLQRSLRPPSWTWVLLLRGEREGERERGMVEEWREGVRGKKKGREGRGGEEEGKDEP